MLCFSFVVFITPRPYLNDIGVRRGVGFFVFWAITVQNPVQPVLGFTLEKIGALGI